MEGGVAWDSSTALGETGFHLEQKPFGLRFSLGHAMCQAGYRPFCLDGVTYVKTTGLGWLSSLGSFQAGSVPSWSVAFRWLPRFSGAEGSRKGLRLPSPDGAETGRRLFCGRIAHSYRVLGQGFIAVYVYSICILSLHVGYLTDGSFLVFHLCYSTCMYL